MIVNNATTKYVDAVEEAMKKQEEDIGIKRTLKEDYIKNTAFAVPGTYVNPNMNTFNSANGYFKVCASLAIKIAKRKSLAQLSERITEWDRCGVYDIWTTDLNSLPGTTPEYIRYPSRKFEDWLAYIQWWGIHNLGGFAIILVDDVTGDKKTTVTGKDCFKGGSHASGIMTTPWVGLMAAVTVLASVY